MRSNSFISASRSSGCSRFRCFGRLRRMVARAPSSSSSGVLAVSAASDMRSVLHVICFRARAAWLRRRWSRTRSGCRAISTRKSTRSSTNSFDTRVVVILAERKLLPSSAISPKNAPSPSLTFLPGRSTSTSPAAMKYMQSPAWPLRMIMVRAGRSMVRSICVTSAIAAGPSAAKNGTLLTDSQVLRKLSRRVSAAKPVARIPVQRPNTPRPQIITKAATSRPSGVIGTTSP